MKNLRNILLTLVLFLPFQNVVCSAPKEVAGEDASVALDPASALGKATDLRDMYVKSLKGLKVRVEETEEELATLEARVGELQHAKEVLEVEHKILKDARLGKKKGKK